MPPLVAARPPTCAPSSWPRGHPLRAPLTQHPHPVSLALRLRAPVSPPALPQRGTWKRKPGGGGACSRLHVTPCASCCARGWHAQGGGGMQGEGGGKGLRAPAPAPSHRRPPPPFSRHAPRHGTPLARPLCTQAGALGHMARSTRAAHPPPQSCADRGGRGVGDKVARNPGAEVVQCGAGKGAQQRGWAVQNALFCAPLSTVST
ncbi:hypothetical protein EI94DRAFT_1715734 [Lactarius quietus]|nr:hypothetical protein EI94DRAFT_1715734 [Lactarius quietus]